MLGERISKKLENQHFQVVFQVADAPSPEVLETVNNGLASYNYEVYGPSARRPVLVSAEDPGTKEVVAGLKGETAWGWLYTSWLWVDDLYRGKRIAANILELAEVEAINRGCRGAHIDTFNEKALRLYENLGYCVFGKIENYIEGHDRYFLKKVFL